MLDGVSLDQLRTFIAAADEGSFSAAGRRLRRAQSVVSQTLANLEGQLGVKLFDRSGHLPVLTDQGRALLADARAVAGDVDLLKARAKSLAGGLEPELSLAVDVMFPDLILRFDMESSGVIEPVVDGRCAIGIVGSWALAPPQLTHEPLLSISAPTVVAAQHPLASHRGKIPLTTLAQHIRITHMDLSDISEGYGTLLKVPRVWRLAHLGAKLAFLRSGLGFGALPLHAIEADLASGALVEIMTDDAPAGGRLIEMWAVYRNDSPPGPAGRWFIERLKQALPAQQMPPRLPPHSVAAKTARRRPPGRLPASKRKRNR
jgi:DNA-binding transcriptional LysR family regulator